MPVIEIPFQDYVRNLRSAATTAPVVAARLQKALPADASSEEKKAMRLLVQRADEVAVVQSERDRMAPAKLRPVLSSFANDWSALYDGLAAKARVAHVSEAGRRAAEIQTSLFPDGISFTLLDAPSAWSEGHRRLDRIQSEKFESAITQLLGEEFMTAVTASTDALADAIGTGEAPRTTPSSTALSEALARFGRAVGHYGRLLAAACDEEDMASVERFIRAVSPIDVHRSSMRGGSDTTSADPQPPVEEMPPHAPAPITSTGNVAAPVLVTVPLNGAANAA